MADDSIEPLFVVYVDQNESLVFSTPEYVVSETTQDPYKDPFTQLEFTF